MKKYHGSIFTTGKICINLALLIWSVELPLLNAAEPSDRAIVAAVLILEAGGESHPSAMAAVMEVIQTRAKGGSLRAVVLKPKQFSCANGTTPERMVARAKRHRLWLDAWKIAGGVKSNLTGAADHYYAHKVMQPPFWADPKKKTVVIGGHTFYKLRR